MGSNIDRHENISTGSGHIGKSGIKFIARYFNKLNIPIILETPYENLLDDLKYLNHILIKQ
jgi:endonuclease IV